MLGFPGFEMRAGTGSVIIGVTTLRNHRGTPVPAIPSWLLEPLWDQFSALLPCRPVYDPSHPLGCHRPRVSDRLIFEKLIQVLRFGCSYAGIADSSCGATTIRERRDEWIKLGIFAQLKAIARESYDRIVGLILEDLAIDGCIAKAPGGGQVAGRSPVDRGKPGMKRSVLADGNGIPLGRVLGPRKPSMPATTRRKPGPNWIPAACTAKSRTRARKRRYRPGNAGPSSAPTHGTTISTSSSAATNATKTSSTRSSISPMPSSRSAASSAKHGLSIDGTPAHRNA